MRGANGTWSPLIAAQYLFHYGTNQAACRISRSCSASVLPGDQKSSTPKISWLAVRVRGGYGGRKPAKRALQQSLKDSVPPEGLSLALE